MQVYWLIILWNRLSSLNRASLSETAVSYEKTEDGLFIVETSRGTKIKGKAIAIAGGLGSFEPRKPQLDNIEAFEEKGVEYFVRNPEMYRDKKIVIAGGGDSALDWSIFPGRSGFRCNINSQKK